MRIFLNINTISISVHPQESDQHWNELIRRDIKKTIDRLKWTNKLKLLLYRILGQFQHKKNWDSQKKFSDEVSTYIRQLDHTKYNFYRLDIYECINNNIVLKYGLIDSADADDKEILMEYENKSKRFFSELYRYYPLLEKSEILYLKNNCAESIFWVQTEDEIFVWQGTNAARNVPFQYKFINNSNQYLENKKYERYVFPYYTSVMKIIRNKGIIVFQNDGKTRYLDKKDISYFRSKYYSIFDTVTLALITKSSSKIKILSEFQDTFDWSASEHCPKWMENLVELISDFLGCTYLLR